MEKRPFFSVEEVPPMFGGGKRDWSVDVLRCTSCFMVCGLHAFIHTLYYNIPVDAQSSEWLHYLLYRMIFGSPTVLFVMVSGIFFLSPERNVTAKKVWKKNVVKMTSAYLFWSLVYALYRIWMMDPAPEITPRFFIQQWLIEPYHMWYIPMILGLYILCPILRPITATRDRKLFLYIILIFIGTLILCTIRDWPGLPYGKTYIDPALNKTPIGLFGQYPMWMLFGWIAYSYRPTRGFRYLIYALGIAATLFGIWCNLFNWIHTGDTTVVATTQKFSILIILKNTALFYFIVTVFRNHQFSERGKKYLRKLSDNTLIIYLIHMLFMYFMFDRNFLFDLGWSPWIVPWIYAFIAYIGGGIVAEIFHMVWNPIKVKLFPKPPRQPRPDAAPAGTGNTGQAAPAAVQSADAALAGKGSTGQAAPAGTPEAKTDSCNSGQNRI